MVRLISGLIAAVVLLAPSFANAQTAPPDLEARAWVLIDAADGTTLAAHRPDRPLQVASATKLMTARLALADLELDAVVRAPRYDPLPAESVLGLERGERIEVRDLLYALMLASANDAAVALAEARSGSVRAFVEEMNVEAEQLGLENTSFANPIGLDDPANFSTASDLVRLTRVLRGSRFFRRVVDTESRRLRSGSPARTIETRNDLLRERRWVTGVKTGHTAGADYVLVSSAARHGIELIGVVLGAESEAARDSESLRLLRHGFRLYERRAPVRPDSPATSIEVRDEDEPLQLTPAKRISVRAREDQEVTTAIEAPEIVEGPIAEGETLGRVVVRLDGEPIDDAPLLAARAVAAPGLLDRHDGLIIALVVAVGIGFAVASRWSSTQRRRRRERERMRARRAEASERVRGDSE